MSAPRSSPLRRQSSSPHTEARISVRSRRRPSAKAARNKPGPLVGVIMGSRSDWETMRAAADTLRELGIPTKPRWCRRTARPIGCLRTRGPRPTAVSKPSSRVRAERRICPA